ncbi:MAG: peptide-methionine (S)-S-oxide reductase MsrA [Pseudomonadota bacterium]
MAKATLGAGCFWGIEAFFSRISGVSNLSVGYAGGHVDDPSYEAVCSGTTGHAEVVDFNFDTAILSWEDVLDHFWNCHDPTQHNWQGPDVGTQYRSVIFAHDSDQMNRAETSKHKLQKLIKPKTVATAIEPFRNYWKAEAYHQAYLIKRAHR